MPADPKDAPRSLKAHNAGKTQQTKGARKLSKEIKQLKQDLQVQIVCCEHKIDEAKKYKEEWYRLDDLLLKNAL